MIKSEGHQVFNVPNTLEGQVFLELCSKYRQKGYHLRARPRGSRKDGKGNNQDCKARYAEWFAVYIASDYQREQDRKLRDWAWEQNHCVEYLSHRLSVALRELHELQYKPTLYQRIRSWLLSWKR